MAINTTAIASTLRPGLAAIAGDYPSYEQQWPEIFEIYESDKGTEIEIEMKFLGNAQIRPEGAPTASDTMGQRTQTSYTHQFLALSFVITQQALEDNLYKTHFPMMSKSLRRSMDQTKDVLGASVLNNAFNPAYPGGDGKPLCSTLHPIDPGVVANRPATGADLSEASLEQALINTQQFRDVAGLICMTKPTKLIVDVTTQYTAERLLESVYRTNTANNDISATYNMKSVPMGYRVNQYLTTAGNWFMLTNSPDGLKHYIRSRMETDVYADFYTDNLIAKAVERYSFGWTNWRAIWGNGPVLPSGV